VRTGPDGTGGAYQNGTVGDDLVDGGGPVRGTARSLLGGDRGTAPALLAAARVHVVHVVAVPLVVLHRVLLRPTTLVVVRVNAVKPGIVQACMRPATSTCSTCGFQAPSAMHDVNRHGLDAILDALTHGRGTRLSHLPGREQMEETCGSPCSAG